MTTKTSAVTRVDKLTPEQTARMLEWRDRWIKIGLNTTPTTPEERERFAVAAARCYEAAQLPPPKRIVWVPSPIVLAIAGPVASLVLAIKQNTEGRAPSKDIGGAVDEAVGGAVNGAVNEAVGGAVRGAVNEAVDEAVDEAVRGAVGEAVRGAVDRAVRGAVDEAVDEAMNEAVSGAVDRAVNGAVSRAVDRAVRGAVDRAVSGAVDEAVRGAVDGAVSGAVNRAVRGAVGGAVGGAVRGAVNRAVRGAVSGAVDRAVNGAVAGAVGGAVAGAVGGAVGGAVSRAVGGAVNRAVGGAWHRYIGGQFWVGGWYWGSPSYVSFFRDVCRLTLGQELDARAQAYAETVMTACWWWPHRDFVMVCERPHTIARDARGRLHSLTGPACGWRGWGVYAVHGVRVTRDIIEQPESIMPTRIDGERNAEVRRVMIERYGAGRYLKDGGAQELHRDKFGILYRKELAGDEPLVMVEVENSTPEPDGSTKHYFLRVHPELRPMLADGQLGAPQEPTAHNAVASTFGKRGEDYHPEIET